VWTITGVAQSSLSSAWKRGAIFIKFGLAAAIRWIKMVNLVPLV
jgi:hypothetical protein